MSLLSPVYTEADLVQVMMRLDLRRGDDARRERIQHVVEAALVAAHRRRERHVSVCEVRRFLRWETAEWLSDETIRGVLEARGWTVDDLATRSVALAAVPR